MKETLQAMGLEGVPVVEDAFVLQHTVQQLVELSKGPSLLHPEALREGLVFRPLTEDHDPELGRLSFKVINPTSFWLTMNEIRAPGIGRCQCEVGNRDLAT